MEKNAVIIIPIRGSLLPSAFAVYKKQSVPYRFEKLLFVYLYKISISFWLRI